MDAQAGQAYQQLCHFLNELASLYGELFKLIRSERSALIASDLPTIESCVLKKEEFIQKIKLAELSREKAANELASRLHCESRLAAIAEKIGGTQKLELIEHQKDLMLLIEDIRAMNKENEVYTSSALRNLHGAMSNVKETLAGKPTYQRKGKYQMGPEQSGNFVSKEA